MKHHIHQSIDVSELYELTHSGKRVVLLDVRARSGALTEQQKATKIANLLTKLLRHCVIVNRGTRTQPGRELLTQATKASVRALAQVRTTTPAVPLEDQDQRENAHPYHPHLLAATMNSTDCRWKATR